MKKIINKIYKNKILNLLYEIFAIPAIIIHELSHLVAGILTITKLRNYEIKINDWKTLDYNIYLYYGCTNPWLFPAYKNFIISYAPLFAIIIISIITLNPYIIGYFLLTFRRSCPSKRDRINVSELKKRRKEYNEMEDDIFKSLKEFDEL